MEDEKIIELLYNHNEKGIIELKEKYEKLLNTISYRIVRNNEDALECVNDTYLKIWNIIPPYKPNFLQAFLCKITRQISIDKYRYNHRNNRNFSNLVAFEEMNYEISSNKNVEDEILEKILLEKITEYIDKLDIESKTIFIRRCFLFEDMTSIANRFNLNEKHISIKLFRIRKKLLKFLESEGYNVKK